MQHEHLRVVVRGQCVPADHLILGATLIDLCPWLELQCALAFHTCRFWFVCVTSILLTACYQCLSLYCSRQNKPTGELDMRSSRCLHLLRFFPSFDFLAVDAFVVYRIFLLAVVLELVMLFSLVDGLLLSKQL